MKMVKQTISAAGSVSVAVLAGKGKFSFDERYFFDPDYRWQQDKKIVRWCEKNFSPYPVYHAEAHLARISFQPRPFRQVGGIQPNLILSAALGAQLVFPGNCDPDIDHAPLAVYKDFLDVSNICWEVQEPVKTFLGQIDELKRRFRNQPVDIFPPFFWDRSGRAAVHGPLTTAVKLIGEEFFTLPYSRFDQARRFINWITESYLNLINLFSNRVGIRLNEIHVGECTGTLFPAEIWERLAVPAMNKMASAAGALRLHSCGHSDHLLGAMKQVKNVRCLNFGSNTSIKKTRQVFGKKIKIDIIPDMQLLQYGSPAEMENWVRKCLIENEGGPLEIQFHLDAGMPFENTRIIFTTLEAEGIQTNYESLCRRWKIPLE